MDKVFDAIFPAMLEGGSGAVIAVLIGVVALLVFERMRMNKRIEEVAAQALEAKDVEKRTVMEILEKYHQGNMTMVQALNEIKVVLAAIQGRL